MAKRSTFAYDGDFYTLTQRIFDYIMLTVLWLLFCLPIFTLAASTSAFYYTTVKVLRRDRGHLWEEFWHSFKMNLREGLFFSILFFALAWVLSFNIGYSSEINSGDFGIFLLVFYTILACLVAAIATYSLASLSRFNMGFAWLLKIGIYMTFRYFFRTLGIILILVVSYFVISILPFMIFFVPTGTMLGISYLMEPVLLKHTPEPEDEKEAEYKWYREE